MKSDLIPVRPKCIVVGIAEMALSRNPEASIVTYSLGSCLGVTIYDPVAQVGGVLHAMLPTYGREIDKARATPAMFVDSGLSVLFRSAYKLGAAKSRIIVKAAGGAELLDQDRFFAIGARNYEALLEALKRNGVELAARAVGGNVSRTVRLHLGTGAVHVSITGEQTFEL